MVEVSQSQKGREVAGKLNRSTLIHFILRQLQIVENFSGHLENNWQAKAKACDDGFMVTS